MSGGYVQRQQQQHQQQPMGNGGGMADINRLETKIDALSVKVESVNVMVAGMMPRAEVDAEIARRVSVETYASDQREIAARLNRLEASPMRLLSWLGAGVGCLGTLISVVSVAFFILSFILTHYKP